LKAALLDDLRIQGVAPAPSQGFNIISLFALKKGKVYGKNELILKSMPSVKF
jgi:hypothetical protein